MQTVVCKPESFRVILLLSAFPDFSRKGRLSKWLWAYPVPWSAARGSVYGYSSAEAKDTAFRRTDKKIAALPRWCQWQVSIFGCGGGTFTVPNPITPPYYG